MNFFDKQMSEYRLLVSWVATTEPRLYVFDLPLTQGSFLVSDIMAYFYFYFYFVLFYFCNLGG
jgi:hypothetical protein